MLVDSLVPASVRAVAPPIDVSDPEAPTVTLSARTLGFCCKHTDRLIFDERKHPHRF